MQMRPEIQIKSAIKAIKDVIIPAIDPTNQLAVEQSQLVIGLLSLLASQLPVQFRFDRDELARLLAASRTLLAAQTAETAGLEAMQRLAALRGKAAGILERCTTDPADLTASVREMREAIGTLVTAVAENCSGEAQLKIEKIVLDMSKEQLLRDRSLMKMQGFEPNPADVPAIEELLLGGSPAVV